MRWGICVSRRCDVTKPWWPRQSCSYISWRTSDSHNLAYLIFSLLSLYISLVLHGWTMVFAAYRLKIQCSGSCQSMASKETSFPPTLQRKGPVWRHWLLPTRLRFSFCCRYFVFCWVVVEPTSIRRTSLIPFARICWSLQDGDLWWREMMGKSALCPICTG